MDEVRAAGTCEACRFRARDAAHLLGETITWQTRLLGELAPGADLWIWSDMLDPAHNARDHFYFVEGDLSGVARLVPRELGVVCWQHDERRACLDHFAGLGMRTLAGAYYDAASLDGTRDWLGALDRTRGAQGVMYTTWKNRYELLAPFGRLVSQRR
jgi:hypothetical protein